MKFGLRYASLGRYSNGPAAVELARPPRPPASTRSGRWSTWWCPRLPVALSVFPTGRMGSGLEDYPIPDPLIWLAYIASATRTIKLGTRSSSSPSATRW